MIEVRLTRSDRSGIENLENLKLPTASGGQIALQEITDLRRTTIDTSVYRKNLQPVVYVTGDVAGGEESPVYAIMKMSDAIDKIKLPDGYAIKQYKGTTMPDRTDRLSMKWDGEERQAITDALAGLSVLRRELEERSNDTHKYD